MSARTQRNLAGFGLTLITLIYLSPSARRHRGTEPLQDADRAAAGPDRDALAYVRTYDVELARSPNGTPAIGTIHRHVRRFGPMRRLELDRVDDGRVIEAEVPRGNVEALGLKQGERLYVKARGARLFLR